MSTRLTIHTGNHLETLARALCHRLRRQDPETRPKPLLPEVIMVQSKGMQRWVSMAIARHNGICANMAFPFPNAFLEKMYVDLIGPLPEHSPYSPHYLTFRIMALFRELSGQEPFEMIQNYLAGGASELKAYQLASRVSDIFDQYLVFRPEMLKQWEKGRGLKESAHHHWQGLLWQRLTSGTAIPHRADLQGELVRDLLNVAQPMPALPSRVSLFGISHLPPFHLQVLDALAHRIPVDLYLLNPCREFWADIISDRQMIKARTRARRSHTDVADLHFERGHHLLSSWGQQGREFFGLTHQLNGQVTELFEENTGQTILGRLQQDILDLVDRPSAAPCGEKIKADGSLRINVCHSPMREVEVLQDQLLDMLDSDGSLSPDEVLVMTPDIAKYAPYIHGVFGALRENRKTAIPYTVADQSLPNESRLVEGFLQLLQLRNSRFEATRVLDLLEYPAIRERFGLETADLPKVEQWINQAHIRWGWDGAHRKANGLPAFQENTWRLGLDRLLMGYAMMMESDELCAGLSPHEGIEGGQSAILGKMVRFAETLHTRLRQIPRRAPLDRWPAMLTGLMTTFLHRDDKFARDLQALRNVIENLNRIASGPAAKDEISFEVVMAYLSDTLNRTSHGTGFMAGSVTFCAMLPMRSIPAKVICILGLQHDAFPQDLHEPGFNLMATDPRPGDRSKRNDDKYLFLEALLSARQNFYISYIGRDIQDNSSIPPSVLVSELLEYLVEGMGIDASHLVSVHPLQSYSQAYFDGKDPMLYSYSKENLEACRQLSQREAAQPFFHAPLPLPNHDHSQLELSSLTEFFQHPVKYLLEQRLGIYLRSEPEVTLDRENFNPDALDRFLINQSIFHSRASTDEPPQSYDAVRAAGRLPHGRVGQVVHDDGLAGVEKFMATLDRHLPKQAPRTRRVEIDGSQVRISGRIDNLYPHARVIYRLAKIRSKDMLALFVSHLAMQATSREEFPDTSIMIGHDAVMRMGPVLDAASILDRFAGLYALGRQRPLPIFPRTSHTYAVEILEKHNRDEKAMAAALQQWNGGYRLEGEHLDPYLTLCKDTVHPQAADFASLAVEIYSPLMTCMEKENI